MALKVGELYALLGLDDDSFNAGLEAAGTKFRQMAGELTSAGMAMTAGITAPIVGAATAALKLAGDMEQAQIAFTSMLGSEEQAKQFLSDLESFAARTPFELPGLVDASRRLLAFGFAADEIIPTMTSIGDAVAALGGGAAEINRVTLALGQMRAKGKVSAEEMMQLAELGIPAWELLAKKIGVDIPTAMKMAERGQISAATGIGALVAGMEGRFAGMMEQQSTTLLGLLSTLLDNFKMMLKGVGDGLKDIAKDVVAISSRMVEWGKRIGKMFAELPKPIRLLIVGILAAAAAIGPLLLAAGAVAGAIGSIAAIAPMIGTALAAIASPAGLIVAAIVAIVAGVVYAYTKFKWFRDAVKSAWDSIYSAVKDLWSALKQLWVSLKPVIDLWKQIEGAKMVVIFGALAGILKIIAFLLENQMRTLAAILNMITLIVGKLLGNQAPRNTFLTMWIDAAIAAVKWGQKYRSVTKDAADAAKLAAQEEADAVLDVIKKRKEAADAERKRQEQIIGFTSLESLYQGAMTAGAKFALSGVPSKAAELTTKTLPGAQELKEIRDSLKREEQRSAELNLLVRERLGLYGA